MSKKQGETEKTKREMEDGNFKNKVYSSFRSRPLFMSLLHPNPKMAVAACTNFMFFLKKQRKTTKLNGQSSLLNVLLQFPLATTTFTQECK